MLCVFLSRSTNFTVGVTLPTSAWTPGCVGLTSGNSVGTQAACSTGKNETTLACVPLVVTVGSAANAPARRMLDSVNATAADGTQGTSASVQIPVDALVSVTLPDGIRALLDQPGAYVALRNTDPSLANVTNGCASGSGPTHFDPITLQVTAPLCVEGQYSVRVVTNAVIKTSVISGTSSNSGFSFNVKLTTNEVIGAASGGGGLVIIIAAVVINRQKKKRAAAAKSLTPKHSKSKVVPDSKGKEGAAWSDPPQTDGSGATVSSGKLKRAGVSEAANSASSGVHLLATSPGGNALALDTDSPAAGKGVYGGVTSPSLIALATSGPATPSAHVQVARMMTRTDSNSSAKRHSLRSPTSRMASVSHGGSDRSSPRTGANPRNDDVLACFLGELEAAESFAEQLGEQRTAVQKLTQLPLNPDGTVGNLRKASAEVRAVSAVKAQQ